MNYLFLITLLLMPILARAESCNWIDDKEIIKYYPPIIELEGSLQDWDTNCKAKDPTYEYMKECWCDVNRARLVELKKRVIEFESKFPALTDKKVCYKEDKFTSRNVSFSSAKEFFKRCNI